MGYGHLVSSVATQAPTPMESPIPRNQPDLLESCRRRHAEKHRGTNSAKTTGQPIQVSAELKAVGERRNSTGSTGPEEALIRTMRRTSAKKNHSAKNQNSERLARPCGDAYLRKHAANAPKKPGISGALGSDGERSADSPAKGCAGSCEPASNGFDALARRGSAASGFCAAPHCAQNGPFTSAPHWEQ